MDTRETAIHQLRVGVLGAARIVPKALIRPARAIDGLSVTAIAARDVARARRFAARHHVPVVHRCYEDLVADPDLDAVYVPLPNGLHAEWTERALQAGKHVLCEKPFTSNEAQARHVAEVAEATPGLVVMEAFHYRYHPLADRMVQIVRGGVLGTVRLIETRMCIPMASPADIRYQYDLAGGAAMDVGCYALHCARLLGAGEPRVTAARALTRRPDVDRAMSVELSFPDGSVGRAHCSLWSARLLSIGVRVTGDRGVLKVTNMLAPHLGHLLTLRVDGHTRHERVPGESSYTHQSRAFLAAVRGEGANLTPPADSILTMRLIDAAYRAAGLPLRGHQGTPPRTTVNA